MSKTKTGIIIFGAAAIGVYMWLSSRRSGLTYAGVPIEELLADDSGQGLAEIPTRRAARQETPTTGTDVERDLQWRINDIQSIFQQAGGDALAINLVRGNPEMGTELLSVDRAVALADLPATPAARLFRPLVEDGVAGRLTLSAYATLRGLLLRAGTTELRNVYCRTVINTTHEAPPPQMNEALAEVLDAMMAVYGYPPYGRNPGAWELYLAVGDSWLRTLGGIWAA